MGIAKDDEARRSLARMRLYFILAGVFVILMALLSSLGEAFIYIFSGLAVFFAFMGWQNWRDGYRDDELGDYDRVEKRTTSSFAEKLRATMRTLEPKEKKKPDVPRERRDTPRPSSQPTATQAAKVKVLGSVIIGGIIFVIFMINVFSGSGDSEEGSDVTVVEDDGGYKTQGDDLYYQGNLDSAYLIYHRGILEDEDFDAGYYGIGNIKTKIKEYDSALYYFDRALEIQPEKFEAAYAKAWVFYEQQNYARSRFELKYIFDKTDQFEGAFLLAGDSYYVNAQYDSAIGYYESAYNLGARSKELMNVMGFIYDTGGKTEQAITFYKETLTYDSTLTDVYKRLGELIPGEDGNYYRAKATGQQW